AAPEMPTGATVRDAVSAVPPPPPVLAAGPATPNRVTPLPASAGRGRSPLLYVLLGGGALLAVALVAVAAFAAAKFLPLVSRQAAPDDRPTALPGTLLTNTAPGTAGPTATFEFVYQNPTQPTVSDLVGTDPLPGDHFAVAA